MARLHTFSDEILGVGCRSFLGRVGLRDWVLDSEQEEDWFLDGDRILGKIYRQG